MVGEENTASDFSCVPLMHICSIMMRCSVCACLCWLLTKNSSLRGLSILIYLCKSEVSFIKWILTVRGMDTRFKRSIFRLTQKKEPLLYSVCLCIYYFICLFLYYIYACINVYTHICMWMYKFVLCCQSVKLKPQSMFLKQLMGFLLYFQEKFMNYAHASISAKDLAHGLQQE